MGHEVVKLLNHCDTKPSWTPWPVARTMAETIATMMPRAGRRKGSAPSDSECAFSFCAHEEAFEPTVLQRRLLAHATNSLCERGDPAKEFAGSASKHHAVHDVYPKSGFRYGESGGLLGCLPCLRLEEVLNRRIGRVCRCGGHGRDGNSGDDFEDLGLCVPSGEELRHVALRGVTLAKEVSTQLIDQAHFQFSA
jgi:hypothetical protein